ncbi:DUF6209 family protein [Nannocystis sp. SCPEA4]|uniref:DUF6209 family protein n=1 Tax=Nannocystis sp. SCPEA4 TaxID=2996787 RepID=UPI00226E3F1C|nr:DUF6209 family protein [Nannocystis sp. SCPEA4]MCY1061149.1 DUF6209 family protein [Nannocystis sp. SCPEA4]
MRPRSLVLSCFVATFACSPEEEAAPEVEVREGTELPDGVEPALLEFRDDWTIVNSGGPLVSGNSVEVVYDVDRLTQCRGEQNGQPAWSITGYHQLGGGASGSFEAGGHSPSQGTEPPIFALEDSGDLALWFHNTSVWGCSAYDSDFGANWHFQVGASLSFKAGWITETLGTPRAGAPLVIAYDPARLPDCRATKYGHDAWNIKVHYRFDGGPAQYALVTAAEGNVQVPAPAVLDVPAGAGEVELWFENQDYYGCKTWDSLFGANYHFALE